MKHLIAATDAAITGLGACVLLLLAAALICLAHAIGTRHLHRALNGLDRPTDTDIPEESL